MRSKFKDEHPFEKRKAEAERIRQKYANRIPVRRMIITPTDLSTPYRRPVALSSDSRRRNPSLLAIGRNEPPVGWICVCSEMEN